MTPKLMIDEALGERYEEFCDECPTRRELDDMRAAIGAVYFEDPADLDIRLLWTRGAVSYFRVNWWIVRADVNAHLRRSVFLRVTGGPDGYRVQEQTPRAA